MTASVGVALRIVPAGVETVGSTTVLRATLVLSPVAGAIGSACAHQVDLATWPQQIEALLDCEPGITVTFAPVRPAPDARPAPQDTAPFDVVAHRAARWTPAQRQQRATQLRELTDCWRHLMAGDDWAHLAAALGTEPPQTTVTPSDASTAAAPAPPRDVVSTGGSALSLLLSLERARSLLLRMADPEDRGPLLPPDVEFARPEERLRTRTHDPARLDVNPWLSAAAPLPDEEPEANPPYGEQRDRERERDEANQRSVRANDRLKEQRITAAAQHKARVAYNEARTATATLDALRDMARQKPCTAPPAGTAACVAGPDRLQMTGSLDQARALHYAGTRADVRRPDTNQPPPREVWKNRDLAMRRFFALQNQPALARLFNLAVDVHIPLGPQFDAILKGHPCDEELPPAHRVITRFAFVTARLARDAARRTIWTTAKCQLWPVQGQPPLFWACTREELDARALGMPFQELLDLGVMAQFDGLIDLGAAHPDIAGPNTRFELATLDPRRAAEADLHADSQAARRAGLTTVGTVRSGGLLLLDRWRQFHAIATAADRPPPSDQDIILDAEALTVGMRLDVGLHAGARVQWRSLMDRRIEHGPPLFDAALRLLLPAPAARASLDAATLVPATRRRDNETGGLPSYFTEEILAHWQGPPLGLDLHGSTDVPYTGEQGEQGEASVLLLRQVYGLPRTGTRPPLQCFGWAVHVGLRPQLQGGVVRPLSEAEHAYDTAPHHRFTLPPTRPGTRGRRILRHERIEHPVVTTPLSILERRLLGPQETATELVIRSQHQERGPPTPLGWTATHRVLVPPPVAMAFADHHDVFADLKPETVGPPFAPRIRPKGGLLGVAYDRKGYGTFPVWSTQETSAGKVYPDETLPYRDGRPDLGRIQYPLPTGDAVFRPIEADQDPRRRHHPYYPDPAAELMVFRLRREDGGTVEGPSLVVRVRRKGVAYPEVTPIAVEVVRADPGLAETQARLGIDTGSGRLAHGHDAWMQPGRAVFLDDGPLIHGTGGGGRVEAIRVVVRLAPGERFQLDVWCMPRRETLEALFDIVESAAQIVQAALARGPVCLTGAAFCAQLATLLPRTPPEVIRQAMADATAGRPASTPGGPCGAGQLLLPGPAELTTIAALIHRAALDTVTPEIAARTTVWVTHALDKPVQAPTFEVDNCHAPANVRRVPAEADHPARVQLIGWVALHRTSTRFLEVMATAPGLVSGAFDDPRRGRSADDQARGIWPANGAVNGQTLWRKPGDVFGFDVAPDGRVTLRAETGALMRVDPIPARAEPQDMLDLAAQNPDPPDPATPDPATPDPVRHQPLSDSKARVLVSRLVAGSRTAPLIRRPDGTALTAEEQTLGSKPRRVLCPAAEAPARVAPLAIMPTFRLDQAALKVTRTCRLRVRMRRPWFSAGEGERLGIVLWPPALLSPGRMAGDVVTRDYGMGTNEPEMRMAGFSDLDLGPGGEYVTRWGGDPTQAGPAPASWLIPPAAFAPLRAAQTAAWTPLDDGADENDVIYVPRASMPLPYAPGTAAVPQRMQVALLAYAPRFDVDAETWFVDVDLDPAAAVEPFVRLGLVRYQANAPPELRVSEPVAEWAQLQPSRTATATVLAPHDGRVPVQVTVTGVSASADPTRPADAALGPQMEVAAYREDADGTQVRLACVEVPRQPLGPAGSSWTATLLLDENPALSRTFVLVTERHRMRPATYKLEPFDPVRSSEDEVADTGPRFAARIDLPRTGDRSAPGPAPAIAAVLPVHDDTA